eukprot:6807-Heterococcus_DN1.PRE.4
MPAGLCCSGGLPAGEGDRLLPLVPDTDSAGDCGLRGERGARVQCVSSSPLISAEASGISARGSKPGRAAQHTVAVAAKHWLSARRAVPARTASLSKLLEAHSALTCCKEACKLPGWRAAARCGALHQARCQRAQCISCCLYQRPTSACTASWANSRRRWAATTRRGCCDPAPSRVTTVLTRRRESRPRARALMRAVAPAGSIMWRDCFAALCVKQRQI